jgi:hypothetical protein
MKKYSLAIVLCIPGALYFGWFGFLIGCFSAIGARPPSLFTVLCMIFWGALGGASLGATPGLLLGWYQGGIRWAGPFLGAAAGAVLGWLFAFLLDVGVNMDLAESFSGPFLAGSVLLGFILGCRPFYRSYHSAFGVLRKPS